MSHANAEIAVAFFESIQAGDWNNVTGIFKCSLKEIEPSRRTEIERGKYAGLLFGLGNINAYSYLLCTVKVNTHTAA
jgi:hypothetical protein